MTQTAPADVVDRLLWRDAQHIIGRHSTPNNSGLCIWCGRAWPCPPRRLAERADEASRRAWRESWTARHDLNGLRAIPGWRADLENLGSKGGRNRGLFD